MYDVVMYLIAAIFIGIIGVFLYYLNRIFNHYLAKWRRHNDKERMKIAMQREAYLNDLYEEALNEEMDDLANRAAKQMYSYGRK